MASQPKDPWEEALDSLSDADRTALQVVSRPSLDVLQDLLKVIEQRKDDSVSKRCKFAFRGKTIVLRDVFDAIAIWVGKFLEVGDVAVQFDSHHAALPWAAIRMILQATIEDTRTFGNVLQCIEKMANSITQSKVIERLYINSNYNISNELRNAIVKHHASILQYLAEALHYFSTKTAVRFVKCSLFVSRKLDDLAVAVDHNSEDVRRLSEIAESERSEKTATALDKFRDEALISAQETTKRDAHLLSVLKDLKTPIEETHANVSDLHSHMKSEVCAKILKSISTVPYHAHHKAAARDRMPSSGRWLLDKHAYRDWRENDLNSILWLHGIPGCGKTKLTSLVIDDLKGKDQVAFFYCARWPGEPDRADGEKILACLVRQLASTDPSRTVLEPVRDKYDEAIRGFGEFEDQAWSRQESKIVILELLDYYPSVTIVLDALDEVNQLDRADLLDTLNDLISASKSRLKIFISSRQSFDIVMRLKSGLNVYIQADDNACDVETFIGEQVEKARFLNGTVTCELKNEVIQALRKRAQGMFRLVDLQIQLLRTLKTAVDIRARLHVLPESLEASYEDIYNDMRSMGEYAFALVNMTFQWILVANRKISLSEFTLLTPSWPTLDGNFFTAAEIRDACSVFISINEDSLQFSHLSVREYFEGIGKKNHSVFSLTAANSIAASACLSYLISFLRELEGSFRQAQPRDWGKELPGAALYHYASVHWIKHLAYAGSNDGTDISLPLNPNTIDSLLSSYGDACGLEQAWEHMRKLGCHSFPNESWMHYEYIMSPRLLLGLNMSNLLEHLLHRYYHSHAYHNWDRIAEHDPHHLSYAIRKRKFQSVFLILRHESKSSLLKLAEPTVQRIDAAAERSQRNNTASLARALNEVVDKKTADTILEDIGVVVEGVVNLEVDALKILLSSFAESKAEVDTERTG